MSKKNIFDRRKEYTKRNMDRFNEMTFAEFMASSAPMLKKMFAVIFGIFYGVLLYLKLFQGNEGVMYWIYISLPMVIYMYFAPSVMARTNPRIEILEGQALVHFPKKSVTLQSFNVIKPGFRYRRLGFFVASSELPKIMYLNTRPMRLWGKKGFWLPQITETDKTLLKKLQELSDGTATELSDK